MNLATKVLENAKGLIPDEGHWCRGHYSRMTEDGFSYCAVGAVLTAARGIMDDAVVQEASNYLEFALPQGWAESSVAMYNDNRATTYNDIMALYDRAIALSKGGNDG